MPASGTTPTGAYEPTLDEARGELARELARREYSDALPTPVLEFLESAWRSFTDWLAGLESLRPGLGVTVLMVAGVAVAIASVLLARPRLAGRATPVDADVELGLDSAMSARDYRELAAVAAGNREWATACLQRFRAMVRRVEERTFLDENPGRTAYEASDRLRLLFPTEADALGWAAGLFNAIHYGNHGADIGDWRRIDELERRLAAATAAGSGDGTQPHPLQAPR